MSSTAASKGGRSKPKASKSVARSSKAALQFPVDKSAHSLKANKYTEHVGTTPVYLSAILEYLAIEVTLDIMLCLVWYLKSFLKNSRGNKWREIERKMLEVGESRKNLGGIFQKMLFEKGKEHSIRHCIVERFELIWFSIFFFYLFWIGSECCVNLTVDRCLN
ncbi:hypothetical protein RHGRI_037403 [Rhododendron griersonianum]|uniref:Histone H2A n=1 Tax=Rhododendron griersonianum TaxID=479676 RepID=A0AAV6HUR8_9ERIC|nr:hypothetical protein RHGRI_037403 [Rhododendron griersonianum]